MMEEADGGLGGGTEAAGSAGAKTAGAAAEAPPAGISGDASPPEAEPGAGAPPEKPFDPEAEVLAVRRTLERLDLDDIPELEDEDNGDVPASEEAAGVAGEAEVRPRRAPPVPRPAVPSEEVVRVVEALIFASAEPLSVRRLAALMPGTTIRQIREAVSSLEREFAGHAFTVVEVAEGYRFYTRPEYHRWLVETRRSRTDARLSPASLETLAVIAYRQPIIRADIEAIRGVGSGPVLKLLMDRGLVKIAGRADMLGRPLLYGTTSRFLERLGMKSLKDLPRPEEFESA